MVSGCRSPLDKPEASRERRPELGEPAATLPAEDAPAPPETTTEVGAATTTSQRSNPTATTGAVTASTGAPPPTRPDDVQLASVVDPGPPSIGAPSYADIQRVTFIDRSDSLRVIVDVASPFPTLKAREVLGLGIDMFRTSAEESDYQLFADGGGQGWRAYLQTPDGFIEYPGTFAVGGTRIVFEVPWTAVGGRKAFKTSVFADWSSRDGLLPQSGRDAAPDSGTADVATASGAS